MLIIAEFIYLGVWAFFGSLLGFFAFGYNPYKSLHENLCRGALSIGIGLFLAFSMFSYLEEFHRFSSHFDIAISGLCAFGLSDFIIKWWPKFIKMVAGKVVDKVIDNNVKCSDDWVKSDNNNKE